MPRPLASRNDQFAQVCPEAKIMGANKACNRGLLLPDERQLPGGSGGLREGRVGPITLPESGLRFHQAPTGRQIFLSRLANHTRPLFTPR
jgi:hypothetical protein